MNNQKRILRIAKGEYLLDVSKEGVVTTHNKDSAMDISGWSFDTFTYFVTNLQKVGYIKAKAEWVDIPEEKEETKEEEVAE
jgi:hypothetical protein